MSTCAGPASRPPSSARTPSRRTSDGSTTDRPEQGDPDRDRAPRRGACGPTREVGRVLDRHPRPERARSSPSWSRTSTPGSRRPRRSSRVLESVVAKPDEERHLPHYGWQSTVTMARRSRTSRTSGTRPSAVPEGQEGVAHRRPRLASGEAIEAKIKSLQDEIKTTREASATGPTRSTTPASAGSGARTSGRIEQPEHGEEALSADRPTKGEYVVMIPGLGPRTRNQIDAEIRQQEEAIAAAARQGPHGGARHPPGGHRRHQPPESPDGAGRGGEGVRGDGELVGEGLLACGSTPPGRDHRRSRGLQDRIDGIDKALADAGKAIAAGTYDASTEVGGASKNGHGGADP